MRRDEPCVIVIGGANGSGKSTAAPLLIRDYLQVTEFVNADVIAQGLSAYAPESVAFPAGRIMLGRLEELTAARASFAFETTLAARSFASWLKQLKAIGYRTHLVFLWLPTPELAIARVVSRVQQGGHSIPNDVIVRRYHAGLQNFFRLYRPIVDSWCLFDNSVIGGFKRIAQKLETTEIVEDAKIWDRLRQDYA